MACGRVSSQGGNTNGRLIALDRAFNELWRADATASNLGMATQLDDAVLVQFDDGVLRAFDAASGAEDWTRRTQVGGIAYRPVAGHEGKALAFDEAGSYVGMFNASDGSSVWSQPTDASGQLVIAEDAGAVVVASFSGLSAFSLDSGAPLWADPVGQCIGAAAGPNHVYAATVQREFIAIDALTGKRVWTRTIDDVFSGVEVAGGVLFLLESIVSDVVKLRVRAYDVGSGEAAWEIVVPGSAVAVPSTPYPVAGHGNIYLFGDERQLLAVDPDTGTHRWEGPKPSRPGPWAGMIAANDESVFLALDNSVTRFDPTSGRETGRHSFESKGNTVVVSTAPDRVFISAFGRPTHHRD